MIIRPLKAHELHLCVPFGQAFYKELALPGQFIPERFVETWLTFLSSYPSVILSLWDEDVLCGGLGGMIVPDLYDGRLCAQEFFWFMGPEHRRGTGGVRLLNAFETWALEREAVEVRMLHLMSPIGAHLSALYPKLGYAKLEEGYRKPLKEF